MSAALASCGNAVVSEGTSRSIPLSAPPTGPSPSPIAVASRTLAPQESPGETVPSSAALPVDVAARLAPYDAPALTTMTLTAPHDTVDRMPADKQGDRGNGLALTVDDGVDSAVVAAYIAFVKATGIRLTFFVNGVNDSWTDNAADLRPLVDSGQVQLGNHTWSHPKLTGLSDGDISYQLHRNHRFLKSMYGVDSRPFYRPPYGFYDDRVSRIAADEGYVTTVMWLGSLGDSSALTETALLSLADRWIKPGAVVIGHANHPTVTHLYPQLIDLIRGQALHTVTLADVYTAT